MRMIRRCQVALLLGTGTILFQGCPASGLVAGLISDCLGEDTISERAFDDLNGFEQLLYEENNCGRYEPRSSFLDDLL